MYRTKVLSFQWCIVPCILSFFIFQLRIKKGTDISGPSTALIQFSRSAFSIKLLWVQGYCYEESPTAFSLFSPRICSEGEMFFRNNDRKSRAIKTILLPASVFKKYKMTSAKACFFTSVCYLVWESFRNWFEARQWTYLIDDIETNECSLHWGIVSYVVLTLTGIYAVVLTSKPVTVSI